MRYTHALQKYTFENWKMLKDYRRMLLLFVLGMGLCFCDTNWAGADYGCLCADRRFCSGMLAQQDSV